MSERSKLGQTSLFRNQFWECKCWRISRKTQSSDALERSPSSTSSLVGTVISHLIKLFKKENSSISEAVWGSKGRAQGFFMKQKTQTSHFYFKSFIFYIFIVVWQMPEWRGRTEHEFCGSVIFHPSISFSLFSSFSLGKFGFILSH